MYNLHVRKTRAIMEIGEIEYFRLSSFMLHLEQVQVETLAGKVWTCRLKTILFAKRETLRNDSVDLRKC